MTRHQFSHTVVDIGRKKQRNGKSSLSRVESEVEKEKKKRANDNVILDAYAHFTHKNENE